MCNEYQMTLPFDDVIEALNATGPAISGPAPNFGPTLSVRIGDFAPVVMVVDGQLQAPMTRWAWKGPGGKPVFNFRSDGRTFGGSTRCIIPATGFYEFTDPQPGEKRKTKWLFNLAGQPLFWIAGIVKDEAFSMLTAPPGPDVAPYHDRQIVVLPTAAANDWLSLTRPEAEVLQPLPAGALAVSRVYPPAP